VVHAACIDPFGGKPVLFAALPIQRVEPTPYRRDVSETCVQRLMNVIGKIGYFLDPIIVVRKDDGYRRRVNAPYRTGTAW
jgi:ParB family chromosome partitioning protein